MSASGPEAPPGLCSVTLRALPTERVVSYARDVGSVDADAQTWDRTTRAVRDAASAALDKGCSLAFEFHGATLTDTAALDLVGTQDRDIDLLIEIVPDDDPALLAREAATVRGWIVGTGA